MNRILKFLTKLFYETNPKYKRKTEKERECREDLLEDFQSDGLMCEGDILFPEEFEED